MFSRQDLKANVFESGYNSCLKQNGYSCDRGLMESGDKHVYIALLITSFNREMNRTKLAIS